MDRFHAACITAPSASRGGKPPGTQNRQSYLHLWQSAEEARIDRTMLIETIHQDDVDKMAILVDRLAALRVNPPVVESTYSNVGQHSASATPRSASALRGLSRTGSRPSSVAPDSARGSDRGRGWDVAKAAAPNMERLKSLGLMA